MPYLSGVNPAPVNNLAASPPLASGGTLSIADLMAVNNTSVVDFGQQDVFRILREFVRMFNDIVDEELSLFVERRKDRAIGVGGPTVFRASFTDEFGVARPQKIRGAGLMGFPLVKHSLSNQWTQQWMRKHTPAEMAAQVQGMTYADIRALQYQIQTAIFTPTNTTFVDQLVDYMTLYVKAFANADSFPMMPSPAGVTFDSSTHTHYSYAATTWPAATDLDTLLVNVTEHQSAGVLRLFVPLSLGNYIQSNPASYPSFAPLTYTDQTYAITLTLGNGTLSPFNPQNRMIGVYKGAEVWVKPWVPDNYAFAFVDGVQKPLAMRIPADLGGDNGQFRMIFQDEEYPTMCEIMEREYGFGVQNRVAGAVLYYANAAGAYVAPTLTY